MNGTILAIICLIAAIGLAACSMTGWGWFLFLAFVFATI